jgi:uncharacterized protein (DUF885 family)
MKKILFLSFVLALAMSACKKEATSNATNETSEAFAQLLADYNEEGFVLNPTSATNAGDHRFNNQFPNYLSDAYKAKSKAYFTKFKTALASINDANLTPTEKMSKAVLLWDCNINLDAFNFQKDFSHSYIT